MAPPPAVILLGVAMIITGTVNTIATKYQDKTVVGVDASGAPVYFFAPGVQSLCMFGGEALCLAVFALRGRLARAGSGGTTSATPSVRRRLTAPVAASFAFPAALDAVATTLINVGLFYSSASVYQMLRGTLAVFAAAFTVLLLKRRLHVHHVIGVVLIAAGAAIVGAASVVFCDDDGGGVAALVRALLRLPPPHPSPTPPPLPRSASLALLGDLLIVGAQAATALQFIVEERVLSGARVPALAAVGLEGVWGLALCTVGLPALSAVRLRGGKRLVDSAGALKQIAASPRLQASTLTSIVSIAAFNTLGITITKKLSGASRAAADAARTLLVWAVSAAAGWEKVGGPATAIQMLGFVVLLSGSALYNELIKSCVPTAAAAAVSSDSPDESPSSAPPSDVETPLLTPPRPRPRSAGAPVPAGRRHSGHSLGDSSYTLARSMRIFPPAALSPHSLASPALGEPLLTVDIVGGGDGGGGVVVGTGGSSGAATERAGRGRVVFADESGHGADAAAAALARARGGGRASD